MGLDVLQGGELVADLPMDTVDGAAGANPYFGGQPLVIETTGKTRLGMDTDFASYIGLAKNSSAEDLPQGIATVVFGAAYVRMIDGSNQEDSPNSDGTITEGAPWDTNLNWAPADKLYLGSAGLWVNNGTAGEEKGIVTKAPATADDALEALMFPGILHATA